MTNADDKDRELTRTYSNRGMPLPGLRLARQRLGLTQRQIASQAGMGQGTITKLERLERGAYPKSLQRLATVLGVSPAELVKKRGDE